MKTHNTRALIVCLTFLAAGFTAKMAWAGMPAVVLTDIARFRLSTISFFAVVYLGASFVIYKLWNMLQKDFTSLPRLSYFKSLGMVFLWGLAFHLVLTMISGTRELMTPQAWNRAGLVYKLSPDERRQLMDARRYRLTVLKKELWDYAEKHDGKFPPQPSPGEMHDAWVASDGRSLFQYVPNLSLSAPLGALVFEPDAYGEERFVLLTNGQIELLTEDVIKTMQGKTPK